MKNQRSHPLQSEEWGKFREKTGIKVVKTDTFQLTIHKIPHFKWTIGYLPKGDLPNEKMIEELKKIGREEKCIFIQLEPKIENDQKINLRKIGLVPSARPLFTRFNFELDITKSEEELLKNMHSKTRYNIRIAEKHNVRVEEDNSDEAFLEYLRITEETTKRQGFFAHTQSYHRLMWETLKPKDSNTNTQNLDVNKLSAHLLKATYKGETLVTWILFIYKDTLYYPYGASSSSHRETMASNLMMWEAIKYGKKFGLKKFDMWGSLGPDADKNDAWYGFHRFKQGYGPRLVEYLGSYDLVINSLLYKGYVFANKIRWAILKKQII
jgi:lipid II:glycine glycyltransferase (peptidoglycan interpeptide bridge formation enzyme)